MRRLLADLSFGARLLRRNPAFTLTALASLTLGIGVNSAIFTLFDAVLLKSLPVSDAKNLVRIESDPSYQIGSSSGSSRNSYSYPMYRALRERSAPGMTLVARASQGLLLSFRGIGERVNGEYVSTDFFEVLGIRPAAGRLFSREDAGPTAAVLSHSYWVKRFGQSSDALGAAIFLNGRPATVIGVLDPRFSGVEYGSPADLYIPLEAAATLYNPRGRSRLGDARYIWLQLFGRLREGASATSLQPALDAAFRATLQREVEAMDASVPAERRERYLRQHLVLLPGAKGVEGLRTRARQPLLLLMAAVGVVLLIACANVASLLLARALARRREAAVRRALGAGSLRLLCQFLAEGLVLALLGGALGLLSGWWALTGLARILPPNLASALPAGLDLRAALFTFAVSAGTALLFGAAPGLQLARTDIAAALRSGSQAAGPGGWNARRLLVAGQVALSVVLVSAAGLFLRSLFHLQSIQPGFRAENLLACTFDPSRSGRTREQSTAFRNELIERVRALPGVQAAAIAYSPIVANSAGGSAVWNAEGYRSGVEGTMVATEAVGPGFLAAIGIPLLSGRECSARDSAGGPPWHAMVNQSFARHFFGDASPLGRRFGFSEKGGALSHEVIGLLPDLAYRGTRYKSEPVVFQCFDEFAYDRFTLHVRAAAAPDTIFPALREEARRLDPAVPLLNPQTVEARIAEGVAQERALAWLTAALGALAMALAGTGIYGAISYAVARRTREIGIRVAVGASRAAVLRLVLHEAARMGVAGVIAGLAASWAVTRFTRGLLHGVDSHDPVSLVGAALAGLLLALAGGWLPARRALRIQPLDALRED